MSEASSERSIKKIVVCCDGTGNEITESNEKLSNVLKFFRCVQATRANKRQIAFYHSGVGTVVRPNEWRRILQAASAFFGLATGYGFDDNVLIAYEFLIENYQDGDEIFLFGFRRGAQTVRVLAALIHKIGLLQPEQRNLVGLGLRAYKQSGVQEGGFRFGRVLSTRWPTIRMIGVWDTVASVIVPRRTLPYFPTLEANLAYTHTNPSVETFRQAIAIDERRRMFRLKTWDEAQWFERDRFKKTFENRQDVKQVWFAGVHADVGGGGYKEEESGLSKFPLLWMIDEAQQCGLEFCSKTVQLLTGQQMSEYAPPDISGQLHNSMTCCWKLLEYLPKWARYKEWPKRKSLFGFYLPAGEPRLIPEGSIVHRSVVSRMETMKYNPINLPLHYQVEPPQAKSS
ncbi:hypothetical protein BKD09_36050 [Bradyrhizobium japonicum]|uniref:T6SS Phospholipase effector Tle1-like catalytic domain-containing protein n=1 Tax=Bradyrhizobium japonicum TaxID=375 RepID=A0A1L3FKR1_BRAJP|nr:DUF2235 domain-containing protein [Bradyrhizobium japonicum]APG13782.1 hypothetical protein BKD09_36050 [Bradyrhizobium japonicum]